LLWLRLRRRNPLRKGFIASRFSGFSSDIPFPETLSGGRESLALDSRMNKLRLISDQPPTPTPPDDKSSSYEVKSPLKWAKKASVVERQLLM
jgi:hypothetical protein